MLLILTILMILLEMLHCCFHIIINLMLDTSLDSAILVTDSSFIMLISIIPALPYIGNRSRRKSFTVAKLNGNSMENIHGWMVVLYGQSLLHSLFHWKSFVVDL